MNMYNVDNLINKTWTRATLYGHLFITVTWKLWSPLETQIIFINVLIHLSSLFIELWPSVYCDKEVMLNCSISYVTLTCPSACSVNVLCEIACLKMCVCVHACVLCVSKCKIIPYIQLVISLTCVYTVLQQ